MRHFEPNTNPYHFDEYIKQAEKAYNIVTSRWEEWDSNWSPADANLTYARSAQLWHDIEDREKPLTLEQFELAQEYKEYMDWCDPSYCELDLCNYAGYNC